MKTLFDWDPSFLTRLTVIDAQHKHLVDLINQLAGRVINCEEPDGGGVEALLAGLFSYARDHFADEERQMALDGVDRRHVVPHREEHQAFMHELITFNQPGEAITHERAMKLLHYLMSWLARHILIVDQSMARQVLAIRGGVSPEQAWADDRGSRPDAGTPQLLHALDGTLEALFERNRELQAANRELERRVAERTQELEEANRRLQLISMEDELTGLLNRRFAFMTLDRLWAGFSRNGRTFAVLLLDADSFKQVNDRYGHATGDTVLRELADRLRQAIRQDDILCRLGGDEFLVICPGSNALQAQELATRVLDTRRAVATDNGESCWNGGVSIGVAETDPAMAQPADLLQAADRAMYAAKREGGGYRVHPGNRAGAEDRSQPKV